MSSEKNLLKALNRAVYWLTDAQRQIFQIGAEDYLHQLDLVEKEIQDARNIAADIGTKAAPATE